MKLRCSLLEYRENKKRVLKHTQCWLKHAQCRLKHSDKDITIYTVLKRELFARAQYKLYWSDSTLCTCYTYTLLHVSSLMPSLLSVSSHSSPHLLISFQSKEKIISRDVRRNWHIILRRIKILHFYRRTAVYIWTELLPRIRVGL